MALDNEALDKDVNDGVLNLQHALDRDSEDNIYLSEIQQLVEYLNSHPEIHTLQIENEYLNKDNLEVLAGFEHITSLVLDGCCIMDEEAATIAKLMPQLTHLDLPNNRVEQDGLFALAKHPNLEFLGLRWQCDGDPKWGDGFEAIARNSNITSLDLSENGLVDGFIEDLAKGTKILQVKLDDSGIEGNLKSLVDLGKNLVTNDMMAQAKIAPDPNTTIEELVEQGFKSYDYRSKN